jgi:hypothetical protein
MSAGGVKAGIGHPNQGGLLRYHPTGLWPRAVPPNFPSRCSQI